MSYNKILFGLALLTLGVTSCKETEVEFDQEKYDAALKASFPVQNVDPTHTWATVGTGRASILLSGDYGTTYDVGIYLENPIRANHATLLYEGKINGSGSLYATFSYPVADTLLYIGIYDQQGRGVAEAVRIENGMIEANIGIGNATGNNRAARRGPSTISVPYQDWNDGGTWKSNDYSTDPSTYQVTEKNFWKSDLLNYDSNYEGYFDMTEVSSDHYTILDYGSNNEMANGSQPLYGDGKHFIVPADKSVTVEKLGWSHGGQDRVIVVKGTLTINDEVNLDIGKSIFVEVGGKLVINNTLTVSNNSRVVNYGTIEMNNGHLIIANKPTITPTIGTDDQKTTYAKSMYNGGLVKEGSNNSKSTIEIQEGGWNYYNDGTININCLQINNRTTITNMGKIDVAVGQENATQPSDVANGAHHLTLINACNASIGIAGVNLYIGCDGSLLNCSTGLNAGSSSKYLFGKQAMIVCGDLYSNGLTLYGLEDAGDYSVFKVTGTVNEVNGYAVGVTTGYVYCDFNYVPDDWNGNQVITKMMKHTIKENGAPNSIIIPNDPDGCTTIGFNPNGNNGGDKVESSPLSLRYCFEDNFPSPGDYDFNDIVMTLTPSVSGKVLTLDVSLDAVGASACLAAAIRVIGAGTADAAVVNGFAKPRSNFGTYANITTDEDFVTKGSDKVIVLFKDAHWAINPTESSATSGSPMRVFYNTVKDRNSAKGRSVSKKTARYTLTFSSEALAQAAAAENKFDVFIINPSGFEIHTVQNGFKLATVLKERENVEAYQAAYGSNMPWAIMLPSTSTNPFKYPIEWTPIGGTKGYVSGDGKVAYDFENGSFADWASNSSNASDWYLHPTAGLVYDEE